MKMINNFDLISPLLEFKDKGDFYTILYIPNSLC